MKLTTILTLIVTCAIATPASASHYKVVREQGWGTPNKFEVYICASKTWSLRDREGRKSGKQLAPGECMLVPSQSDDTPNWAIRVQGRSGATWYLAATKIEKNRLYSCDLALFPTEAIVPN